MSRLPTPFAQSTRKGVPAIAIKLFYKMQGCSKDTGSARPLTNGAFYLGPVGSTSSQKQSGKHQPAKYVSPPPESSALSSKQNRKSADGGDQGLRCGWRACLAQSWALRSASSVPHGQQPWREERGKHPAQPSSRAGVLLEHPAVTASKRRSLFASAKWHSCREETCRGSRRRLRSLRPGLGFRRASS